MKKLFWAILLFVCASSEAYSQFYLGASVGNSFINKDLDDVSGDDFNIDENSFAYKIFGGFGIRFIGVEGGYRDLGEVKSEPGQTSLKSNISGWDVAAKGKLHLGPIMVFAKAGSFFAKYKNEVGTYSYKENSTNFLWGVGAGLQLRKIGLRLEYEGLGEENSKLSMLSFGGTLEVGGKGRK